MGIVDDIMDEMKAESQPPSLSLPWRSPDYKPTPEAIAAFREPAGPVSPEEGDDEDDDDSSQQAML